MAEIQALCRLNDMILQTFFCPCGAIKEFWVFFCFYLNIMTKIRKEIERHMGTEKRDRNKAREVISHHSNMGQQKRRNAVRRKIRAAMVTRSFLGKSLRTKWKQKTILTFLFRHQLLSVLSSPAWTRLLRGNHFQLPIWTVRCMRKALRTWLSCQH